MVVLTVLPNLSGAVSPCKFFFSFYTIDIYNLTYYNRICWPISADQPAAAAHLTENLNVAFELFQVRTGDGLKPIARNGGVTIKGTREAVGVEIRQTIDSTRSEEGLEMRRNAEQIKKKFAKAWEDGEDGPGKANREIREFLRKYSI